MFHDDHGEAWRLRGDAACCVPTALGAVVSAVSPTKAMIIAVVARNDHHRIATLFHTHQPPNYGVALCP
jgi:hypothetical protein